MCAHGGPRTGGEPPRGRSIVSTVPHRQHLTCGVPVSLARIGEAGILCARTRPKYIGGSCAVYQTDELEVPR
ncbi:MAG: DUF436 family protein [Ruthenibacterium lactatiformans]